MANRVSAAIGSICAGQNSRRILQKVFRCPYRTRPITPGTFHGSNSARGSRVEKTNDPSTTHSGVVNCSDRDHL
eukprot:360423-Hanusia_phi.AAC.2